MMLTEKILESLSSSGNSFFQVLFNYNPLRMNGKNVFVRKIFIKSDLVLQFGYFVQNGGTNTFTPIDECTTLVENVLKNKVIAGFDFSREFPNDDFIVEVNPEFKLVNIVQSCFNSLCNEVYRNVVKGSLTTAYQTLSLADCEVLFNYFEDVASASYLDVLDNKVLKRLRSDMNFKFYNSLTNYVVVYFKGPCLLNPFVDCGKYKASFENTEFFKLVSCSRFNMGLNEVGLLTHKEICLTLGLSRFVKFNTLFLMNILLGLLNPVKFYSKSKQVYVVDGRVVSKEDYESSNLEGGTSIPSLLLLMLENKKRLKIKNDTEWYEIIKDCTLL